jgi:hypothetical protein
MGLRKTLKGVATADLNKHRLTEQDAFVGKSHHHEDPAEIRVLSGSVVLVLAQNKAAPLGEVEPSQENNPDVASSIVEPDEGILNPPLPPVAKGTQIIRREHRFTKFVGTKALERPCAERKPMECNACRLFSLGLRAVTAVVNMGAMNFSPPELSRAFLWLHVKPDDQGPQPSQGQEGNHRVKGEIDCVDAEGARCLLSNTHLGYRTRVSPLFLS